MSGSCVAETRDLASLDLRPDARSADGPKLEGPRPDGPRAERASSDQRPPDGAPKLDKCTKQCNGVCVSYQDPAHGCAAISCAPCPAPANAVAGCNKAGACTIDGCAGAAVDCDGNLGNGCNDLTTDAQHCGRCAHDCLGGSCAGGHCQPITVASGQPWPMAIAVDSTLLYWANSDYPTGISSDGKVMAKVKATGQNVTVANGKVNVDAIAIDSGALYFATAEAQGTVHRQMLASPLETIATSQAWAVALAVNANAVYWPDQPTSSVPAIVRYDKQTKSTTSFAVDSVAGLAVDAADTVYWTNGSAKSGKLEKRPKGSITTTLAAQQLRPWALVLDGSTLFWVNRDGGSVMSISTQGGNPVTIATGGTEHVGIAVDAQFVYWTDFAKGEVRYAPRAGGAAEILASGQSSPHFLAVDQSAVYWTNYVANGAVMKVARP